MIEYEKLDEKARRGLQRHRESLLLAAIDMEQTIAAAHQLEEEAARGADGRENHHQLLRSIECAIAVTYARAFVESAANPRIVAKRLQQPRDSGRCLRWHVYLLEVRHKSYAHTDPDESRRSAAGDLSQMSETWVPFILPGDATAIITLAEHQRDRFRSRALGIPNERFRDDPLDFL